MDESTDRTLVETAVFPGRFESLAEIGEFIARVAEAAGFDERGVYAIQLAVDEACSNIIEHAYGGEDRGVIECTCRVDEEDLTVVLRDHGRPFDPSTAPEPVLNACLEEREGGNLGLFFMRRLMDEVRFECVPGSVNVLTMVKHREVAR
jgi:serine/threonine-protein kinase RsbW